jgi:adenine deaminase
VAFVGADASHTVGKDTVVIDARGKYLVPGLLDGHMHVESGMVTITEFVRTVAQRGTTCMFIDPHEIANVFGLKGVKLMVDEAHRQPIHVWVQIPSCVPSAPGFETPDLARRHRPGRDDELPRRGQERRKDAGRDGAHTQREQNHRRALRIS